MASSNRITKVAIVGAGGNSGSFMTQALLATRKHTVTAITRADSQSKLPEGVVVKKVDYAQPQTLVEALRGQDALVITLGGCTPKEIDLQLVKAAARQEWLGYCQMSGLQPPRTKVCSRMSSSFNQKKVRKAIEDLENTSYIAVSTGFWYEWSLAIPPAFGFDFASRSVTFLDDGETKISISTWPQACLFLLLGMREILNTCQVGRAVATLLSLPIEPEGSTKEACLQNLRNKVVYINSFTISQEDMLDSVLRVTDTKMDDWTITKEPAKERYSTGMEKIKEGKRIGFAKMLYTRVFYSDGSGDVEHNKGTINNLLNLPTEDIDEATRVAIERSKSPSWTS